MTEKTKNKLSLDVQTIKQLNDADLENVAGGTVNPTLFFQGVWLIGKLFSGGGSDQKAGPQGTTSGTVVEG